ncbi:uncharacterized protein LOC134670606 [Cydia fagiglandana]|uniref:uncharacterized protein LOC134670606 n=1 Tax=Cydia fagiglandana TaxID=1458189 RepID=UPI002FEDEEC4
MYSFMTVVQLKNELRQRNASVTGKKADLIERLEAYDRNFNFGADPGPSEDPRYECPPVSCFKDINADSPIPPLDRHEIQAYFEKFNAQNKGKDMYESRCLLTARYASVGASTYFQGQCKAQMKKVTYIVNVKVSKEGNIEQANCECAAGSGIEAHCKHVSVLLCAVEDMCRTKTIMVHQVTTQKLMTFKRPHKVFYRSPIQAQNLPMSRPRKQAVNFNPLKREDMMENYQDYVHNLAINFGKSTMPILQTIKPANPYAIEWDHSNYTNRNEKELLLERLLLKNVTPEQIVNTEKATKVQDKSKEWHNLRCCRVTASNFHVACHATTGKDHLIQRIMNPRAIHTRAITHGKIHESTAIAKYEEYFGLKVEKSGLHISEEFPFLAASPDGLLGDETVIEVKCPYAARYMPITAVTVPYLESIVGKLHLKRNHPYFYQIQGQLYCSKRKYCNLIIYTFKEIQVIFLQRDDCFINEMVTKLVIFFENHLKPEIINKYYYRNYDLIKP